MMKNKHGFIALTSILIIGSLVLLISIGLSARSISETKIALSQQLSNRALALADACAEYALNELKADLNYPGNESIIIDGSDSCDILPIETSGSDKIVKTRSIISGYAKKIRITVSQTSPEILISSWIEVPDF